VNQTEINGFRRCTTSGAERRNTLYRPVSAIGSLIQTIKQLVHNAFMLEQFISISGFSPKCGINDILFKELLFHGARDAG